MSLRPGSRIGAYDVIASLGSGGMGEVYRAHDRSLGRDVALKVLPEAVATDPSRLHRFELEARSLAALNHPNIAQIYGLETDGGAPAIAMELVEGEDLSAYLSRGPMPLADVRPVALQVIDGLEAAHDRGIVHRDLKPANIKRRPDGGVKILDFGLAKPLLTNAAGDTHAATVAPLTGTMVVGTPAYMSPEQARGLDVDQRTDIWAFGCVLFELLAGRRAFNGDSATDVLAAVLTHEPLWDRLPAATPTPIRRLLRRCLAKDAPHRLRHISDARFDLIEEAVETSTTAATRRHWPSSVLRWAVVGLAVAAGLVAVQAFRDAPVDSDPATMARQITHDSGVESFPRISPDGSWVIYSGVASGNSDIYMANIGGQGAVNLTKGVVGDDTQPALSRDGQAIAFRSERDGGGIFVMGRLGESPRRISRSGYNPSWSPDGRQIAVASDSTAASPNTRNPNTSRLTVVDVASGQARLLETGDAVQPAWSPHGHRIAYWGLVNRNQRDLWTVGLDGSGPVQVTNDAAIDWSPTWSPDGRWLYFCSDRAGSMNAWRIAIDELSGATTGQPEALRLPSSWVAHLDFDRSGRRVVFASFIRPGHIQRTGFDPVREAFIGSVETITSGSQLYAGPAASPDGRSLVLTNSIDQAQQVMVSGESVHDFRQLTFGADRNASPRWSPDGRQIAFHSNRDGGQYRIWRVNIDGSELTALTVGSELGAAMGAWSSDGRRIAVYEPATYDAFLIDARAPGVSAREPLPRFEPGGGFLPVNWSSDDSAIIGVAPSGSLVLYSLAARAYSVLADRGAEPRWFPDGRRLFFTRGRDVTVLDVPSGRARVIPTPMAEPGASPWRLSPDGRTAYRGRVAFESDVWLLSFDADSSAPSAR